MADKDIRINFKTTAELKSAEDVKTALSGIEDRLRKIENDGESKGLEKRIKKMRKLVDETGRFADFYKGGFEEGSAAAGDFEDRLNELFRELADIEGQVDRTAESMERYIEKADSAAEAMEKDAEAAQRMKDAIGEINFAQHIQAAGQFAKGLRTLAEISKENGQEELAGDLDRAAKSMDVVAGAAAGGLNLAKIVKGAGGVRVALGKVTAFLTGPVGIALAAATTVWELFQLEIKKASDAMDATLEKNSKSVLNTKSMAEAEKSARESITEVIKEQEEAVERLLTKQREELQLSQEKQRLTIAQTNADKAIALAEVDAARSAGEITEVEAIKARAEIEREAVQKIHDANRKVREENIATLERSADDWVKAIEQTRLKLESAREQAGTRRAILTDSEKERVRGLREGRLREEHAINKHGYDGIIPLEDRKRLIGKINEELAEVFEGARKRTADQLRGGKTLEEVRARVRVLEKELQRNSKIVDEKIRAIEEQKHKLQFEQKVEDIQYEGRKTATGIRTDTRVRRAEEEEQRREAERKAREAREAAAAASGGADKLAADLEDARKSSEQAASEIGRAVEKGLATTGALDDAADRVGEVVKAVESSKQKQAAANRRLQSAVAKNGEVVTRALTAAAKEQERVNRRLEVLEETVRSLA